jgi:hypothetical protein
MATATRRTHNHAAISVLLLLFAQLFSASVAYPSLLVDSPKPHCVSVEAAQDTVIQVGYHAPGTLRQCRQCGD